MHRISNHGEVFHFAKRETMQKTIDIRTIIEHGNELFHRMRYPDGIVFCPYCGCIEVVDYGNYHYRCKGCGVRFSDRTRTLLHNSKLSTTTWLHALYEMVNTNFISSVELSRKLSITQKSAWLIQAKIRYSMGMDDVRLQGTIAQDEMYIGGCLTNYHYGRKIRLLRENNLMGENDTRYTKSAIYALNSRLKQPVFGMNDGERIVLYATPNPIKSEYIHTIYKKHVVGDCVVVSDESKLYDDWEKVTGSPIYTNNHHNNQYKTEGGLTSNRIENTFSWYKRGFAARITHCKEKYLQLYLNEFCFRVNHRTFSRSDLFESFFDVVCRDSVTYKDIRAYDAYACFGKNEKRRRHIYTMSDIKMMIENNSLISTIKFGKTEYRREDFK